MLDMRDNLDFMLFDALRHTSHSMRANHHHCKDGKPAKREIILAILADNEGGMRQNQLASAFRVSPSTLSEMLNRLEADGMIKRESDPADRRATLLKLTDKGVERTTEIKDDFHRSLSSFFSNLTDDEKRQLIALLKKIPQIDENECE